MPSQANLKDYVFSTEPRQFKAEDGRTVDYEQWVFTDADGARFEPNARQRKSITFPSGAKLGVTESFGSMVVHSVTSN